MEDAGQCLCGEVGCPSFGMDYPWCRPCGEHHRPPECPVDEEGYPLQQCGCRWESDIAPLCKHTI